jgi:hypothetical protein
LPRWDKHDPTDLEELTCWTTLIIFGGIALAIIVILLVVLAFWDLLSQPLFALWLLGFI